jgi:tRNA-dihydrouridine synthase A
VPPLDYARVYRLKAAHPELTIVLNGGIENLDAAAMHLEHVDGVMLGRAAYQTPYILAEVDRRFFEAGAKVPTRAEAIEGLIPHIERHLAAGGRLNNVVRHVLGLYHGEARARVFRRHLSENAPRDGARLATLFEAVSIADPSWRPLAAAE